MKAIHIVGAGMAGSEAAWQIVSQGVPVVLHEMRPQCMTDAHTGGGFAELVCSNSFRADDSDQNAVGLLHWEMRKAGSLIMHTADQHQVPAGGALAVDRVSFSDEVSTKLKSHPLVSIEYGIVDKLPPEEWGHCIIATGPLTHGALASAIQSVTGEGNLAFFDAIAPIVYRESINLDVAWFQSRYDKTGPGGTGKDYINCPLDREQYGHFISALLEGEKADFREFEKSTPYFSGCLPIEVMAAQGPETLRHGPMKARGLTDAHNPTVKAYAVVQLRQDNKLGTLYNIVGFQTKLKYAEQVRIFRTIPGLENAEFARLGGLHRNTFINSPRVLDEELRLQQAPHIRFAGQITGVEGYVESAAIGLMAGRMAAAAAKGERFTSPPATTAHGALLNHITGGHVATTDAGPSSFQPMNVNFGLFPPVDPVTHVDGKRLKPPERTVHRKRAYTHRAKADFTSWLDGGEMATPARFERAT